MGKEIILKPKFLFKDYFKANLYFQLSRPLTLIVLITMFLLGTFCSLAFLLDDDMGFWEYLNTIFPFFIFPFILVLISYLNTKRTLSDPKLKENIEFNLNENHIEEVGESFRMKYNWSEILKIKERKEFFLIYISKRYAKVISKSDLKDNQYNDLKELFKSLDIKKSLK